VVWLAFDPQAGHEQAGHRPALVISPASYNGKKAVVPADVMLHVRAKMKALLMIS
jgi:mRNA-degrading endonuclease toxin of MazEF toxin-antitoxin module